MMHGTIHIKSDDRETETSKLCCVRQWFEYTGWRKNERKFFNLPAISFFGVTSNQKSTFENLVQ